MHFNSGISHLGMGEVFYYGVPAIGIKKNKKLTVKHFRKAINNSNLNNYENDRRAYWRLGEMHYWGEGCKKDRDAAI